MRNKYKLLIGIILIVAAIGATYFSSEITGYITGDIDAELPDGIPKTDNRIIYSPVQAVDAGDGVNYALIQKYRVGNNDYCIMDCKANCTLENLEYYKAYVQSYGYCMCKCLPD